MNKYQERSKLRISIAKEYLDNLKEKLGKNLERSYLYGSTVRYCCRELSDIDIILEVKQNDSKLVEIVETLSKEYELKYRIPLSAYYRLTTDSIDEKVRKNLSNEFWIFSFRDILSRPYLKYPEQFINITYP